MTVTTNVLNALIPKIIVQHVLSHKTDLLIPIIVIAIHIILLVRGYMIMELISNVNYVLIIVRLVIKMAA